MTYLYSQIAGSSLIVWKEHFKQGNAQQVLN